MGAIVSPLYQAVFMLSLVFLAIVPAIYVLAVSLLGRSVSVARTAGVRLRRTLGADIATLQKQLSQPNISEGQLKAIERQIRKRRSERRVAERGLRSIRLASAVLIPGALFLAAALLQSFPITTLEGGGTPHVLWCFSLVPFGAGLVFLVRVLLSIRSIVDLSVPNLSLQVDADCDPWRVGHHSNICIKASLERGDTLPQTQLVLFVPPNCEVSGSPIWTVSEDDYLMPGYKAIGSNLWDYRALAPYRYVWHHLKPTEAGTLRFFYGVYGPGYTTPPETIDIQVIGGYP